jgi:TPR repeat protein
LKSAAHYFKLSADQGNSQGQYCSAMSLLTGSGLQCDIAAAIRYFTLSAENGSSDGQAVVGWMAENGINTARDLVIAVQYYELSAEHSIAGALHFGQCCQRGRGVPVDFMVAAESFRRAAAFGDADGANSFGCCLELGEGVDRNIELAVKYYCQAASQLHPSGLYNFGRCLEYGRGIECDLVGAAKYYRMAAELGDPSAQNSFGVFLERGIVFRSNQALAAHYFERSAVQGDRDGANNLGFCLEHKRGVRQNIEAAAGWYRFAADGGHPEGEVNYQRCLRLLGQWKVPDRSACVADRPRPDNMTRLFLATLEDSVAADHASAELVASIKQLKDATAECAKPSAEWVGCELAHGNSNIVLTKDREEFMAVKTAAVPDAKESIQREIGILKTVNHPLVVHIRGPLSGATNGNQAVVTEFVENGSLADHLSEAENGDLYRLSSSTKIVRVIAGIVLAMRFLHSRNVIHRDLTPNNILLDWNWNVRICDFGDSVSPNHPEPLLPIDHSTAQ